MGRTQRYRGVRQRHWGSWVSEIRHPLLKTRVWLGTFETAEDAAHAYDEAARLMCGIRARTNFPLDPNAPQNPKTQMLSATLTAKLQRWYLASQDHNLVQQQQVKKKDNARNMEQSLTCLCLDTEQSNLGIWQKKTGRQAEANWLRKVEFGSCNSSSPFIKPEPSTDSCMSEEDKFASEMIEELLGHNSGHLELMSPSMSDSSCSSTSCLTAFS
ncbi:hypothetical protein BDL97_10G015600 [Sphagnum fallax]|jgi:hypothetical protein|nr:hypothetical protein BDL97_10G015600 [Sphagnum fallax]